MIGYRKFVARLGRKKAVLFTTFLALLLSLSFTGIYEVIMSSLGFDVKPLTAIIVSVAVTLTVTPLLSWNFIGIFLRIHHLEEEMRIVAHYDQLTGLLSRHGFFDRAKIVIELCLRENFDFTVALLDIDKFKQINDEHGHLFGDEVLANIGSELKKNIRENDLACRFGGDEFIFLFPNVSIKNRIPVHGRLEKIIRKTNRTISSKAKIGMSLGLASHSDVNYNGMDSMIAAADYALYRAKERTDSNIHIFCAEDAKTLYNRS